MTYGLFCGFTAAPGKRNELAGYLLRAAELMQQDQQCLLYVVAMTQEPDEVAVCEVWTDEAAHNASLNNAGVPELIAEARKVIAGVTGRTPLQVRGGKGLRS